MSFKNLRKEGRLIIISAPSGAGKTSVIQYFLATHPFMIHSVSCTTRPKRLSEVNGNDYHFIPAEEFQQKIAKGEFAEWALVHNQYYGTPRAPLDRWLQEKKDILLDLDVQGGLNLKKLYPQQAISIFLLPPSEEELERRLKKRGTDSLKDQEIRLKNAKEEMTYKELYDYQVINENLEKTCKELEEILSLQPLTQKS